MEEVICNGSDREDIDVSKTEHLVHVFKHPGKERPFCGSDDLDNFIHLPEWSSFPGCVLPRWRCCEHQTTPSPPEPTCTNSRDTVPLLLHICNDWDVITYQNQTLPWLCVRKKYIISKTFICQVLSCADQVPAAVRSWRWAPHPNCDASVKRRGGERETSRETL